MKIGIIIAVAVSIVFLIALLYLVNVLNLKKRFSNHRIVRGFADRWSDAIIQQISQAVASENDRFLVVADHSKISDDSILCDSCSVFFNHEHMRHLQKERERRLMAYSIAGQIKKHVTEKCSSIERLVNKKYHIKTKCQSVSGTSQKGYLVYIHYIEPNEAFVPAEKW